MENIKNEKIKKDTSFIRLILLVVPLFLVSVFLETVFLFSAISITLALLYFMFFRNNLWILLVLAAPSLCLGNLVNIPVTDNWVYEARLAEIFIMLCALLYFLDIYLNKKINSLRIDFLSFVLYLYLIASALSIFYIVDFRLFVFGMKVSVYSFLAYFLTRQLINSKRKIEWFLHGIATTVIILGLQVFYKFYELGFSSAFFFERNTILLPIGPLATTAAILALLVPIILAFYFQLSNKKPSRLVAIAAVMVGVTAIFLSLGKAAIASLLLGFAYLFLKLRSSRVPLMLMSLWFLFLSYVLLNPFFSGVLERFKNAFVDTNTKFRVLEYQTSWKLIENNPLFGVGPGQQLHYFKDMLNFETTNLVNNYFMQAMIDLGLVGLALVVLIVADIIIKSRRAIKESIKNGGYYLILLYGFVAGLIVSFFNGLAEVTFYALPYAIAFWLLMGVYSNIRYLATSFD